MAVCRKGLAPKTDILTGPEIACNQKVANAGPWGLQLLGCTPQVCLATSGLQRVAEAGPTQVANAPPWGLQLLVCTPHNGLANLGLFLI